MSKKQGPRTTSRDPVTRYARAVVEGKIIAGPHVRNACARHLKDLEEAAARGFFFDIGLVNRAINFFKDVLHLNGGQYEGMPYELLGWQAFIVGSIFGWIDAEGLRRFRTAYVETAKGSGKSPLAAGIGHYGLMADREPRAEIYAAATKKDQAMILFRDAVAMRDQSPELASRLTKSGVGENVWNLAYHAKGSWFRPLSADDGQSGPRPHFALLDEIHEHKNNSVIEMLKAGQKSRRQPLQFGITNSGSNKQSVCWELHDYGAKVVSGALEDDSFFAFICSMDEGDDPFADETCWYKSNPSLKDGLPGLRYLRDQVREARGMPSKEALVRRVNFCQWTDAINPWISADIWRECKDSDFDDDLLIGRRCWGGLDLSSTQDLTALALMFEPTPEDPFWRLKVNFWLPGDGLENKVKTDRVPYNKWRDDGWLSALPGRAINKLAVLRRVVQIISRYNLVTIGFDRWRIEDLKQLAEEESLELPLIPFGQGYKDMAPAVDVFESLLLLGNGKSYEESLETQQKNKPENGKSTPENKAGSYFDDFEVDIFSAENTPKLHKNHQVPLRHDGNPVMNWCAANAVVTEDPAGNRKVDKQKATGRVDGIVAAIMACGQINKVQESDTIEQGFVSL